MESRGFYKSPMGRLEIIMKDGALAEIRYKDRDPEKGEKALKRTADTEDPSLMQVIEQLEEYFSGVRKSFTLEILWSGTPFEQKVYRALQTIPYGETRSYKEIAEQIGHPKAFRAVGSANRKNPLPIVVPCHRVIGAKGDLVGYNGGIDKKTKLLSIEKLNG